MFVNTTINSNSNSLTCNSPSGSSINSSLGNNSSSKSSTLKENLPPERKLVYFVKSITKHKASHNNSKLLEIAKNMYNDSKQEDFPKNMKRIYEKQTIKLLKDLSKQNYSDAEYFLGKIYQEKAKHKKAAKFFELSYKNKHPMGTYELGQCYELGNGKIRNHSTAETLYRKAATVGYCQPAMVHLGMSYLNGSFGNKNIQEAVHWFKKATSPISENADKELIGKASYELYKLYVLGGPNGDGSIPQDIEEALVYLKMSAKNGSTDAVMEICNIEKHNPRKLLYWTTKGAELGCLDAQIKLATWYLCNNSKITKQNKALGFYWLKQASLPKNLKTDNEKRNQGCIQFILGTYYETGIENVQPADENEALYWFSVAAKLGIKEAIDKVKEKQIQYNYKNTSLSEFINEVLDKGLYGKPSESLLECQQVLNTLPNKSHYSTQLKDVKKKKK